MKVPFFVSSFVPFRVRILAVLCAILPGGLLADGTFSALFTFPADTLRPSKLIQATDGNFYGTTQYGGAHFKGSVFKISTAGVFTTLYNFADQADGAFPKGGVVEGTDGNFYGTTTNSLPNSNGTVFKITPAGILSTIHHFSGYGTTEGYDPSPLISGTDGNFYGTSSSGGANGIGIVFQITPAGVLTTVCDFPYTTAGPDSSVPLVQGTDGNFYGVSPFGGSMQGGIIFKATTAGTLKILHNFNFVGFSQITLPGLYQASDGNFYGVKENDGSHREGVIFRITSAGAYAAIHNFSGPTDGAHPQGGVIQAGDGNLYGTTTTGGPNGGGTLFRITLAGSLTTLQSYSSDILQPRMPAVTLTKAGNGNLYGLTSSGGTNNRGIMFRLSPTGVVAGIGSLPGSVLGSNPTSLTQGSGAIFGTTEAGGDKNSGTIFKRTPSGTVTTLHSFSGLADGADPSRLLRAKDGNFYGTTSVGSGGSTAGTIFKITPSGGFTLLATFPANLSKGGTPSSLVQAGDGNFYGTTGVGGTSSKGTVFKFVLPGSLTTLHNFSGQPDGGSPSGALTLGKDGNLYGIAQTGDTHDSGIIFKLSLSGSLTALYNFTESGSHGGSVVQSYDGNFYGVLQGNFDTGLIFRLTPTGDYTDLHDFDNMQNGAFPRIPLIQAADGHFYGMTTKGGTTLGYGNGIVFRFSSTTGIQTAHFFTQQTLSDTGPASDIIQGADGNFYGTTASVQGTLFKLTFPPAVFANISTRLSVGTGENVLIGGFIITGSQPKKVIIRGLGPSLVSQSVGGVLVNPVLELHKSSTGQVIATNDDWGTSANRQAIIDSQVPPTNAKEAAILMTLSPGSYTAILRGANNSTGIGLVEAYDLDTAADSKLANISSRGFVQTGNNVMIGGIIAVGDDFIHLIVRAIGPSLAQQGVRNALTDPVLELHDANGFSLAANDNWMDTERESIEATGIPPKDSRESAIDLTVQSGRYTAIVRGKNNATGVALVEAYQLKF